MGGEALGWWVTGRGRKCTKDRAERAGAAPHVQQLADTAAVLVLPCLCRLPAYLPSCRPTNPAWRDLLHTYCTHTRGIVPFVFV